MTSVAAYPAGMGDALHTAKCVAVDASVGTDMTA